MRTAAKAIANRRNALLSTGPRTPEGKGRSSVNATKHGLLSSAVVLPGESEAELRSFAERLRADLSPVGALEEFLVDRIIASAWRLRRTMVAEVSIFAEGRQELIDVTQVVKNAMKAEPDGGSEQPARKEDGHLTSPSYGFGIGFEKSDDPFGKLARYEAAVERGLYRALHELQRLQESRQGRAVLAPVAVDIDVTRPAW